MEPGIEVDQEDTLSTSEALWGLAGWLTTREEGFPVGASASVMPLIELIGDFCKLHHLDDPRPGWEKRLKYPATGFLALGERVRPGLSLEEPADER